MKHNLKILIENIVNEELVNESYQLSGKDMNYLKNMSANEFLIARNFLKKQNLKIYGSGSSRIVFGLSTSKVFKLAKDKRGIAQNKVEVGVYTNPATKNIVTKIYDFHPDFLWVISEGVQEFKKNIEFRKSTGLYDYTLKNYIEDCLHEPCSVNDFIEYVESMEFDSNGESSYINIDFIKDLYLATIANNLGPDEFVYDHFGKTLDGRIVLLDYGYDDEVRELY